MSISFAPFFKAFVASEIFDSVDDVPNGYDITDDIFISVSFNKDEANGI